MNDERPKAVDLDEVREQPQTQRNGAEQPKSNVDSPSWRQIFARMAEDDRTRFKRHKAMIRGAIMKAFTETLPADSWTESDDNIMDLSVSWLLHLQRRAGVQAKVATEQTEISTHDPDEGDLPSPTI